MAVQYHRLPLTDPDPEMVSGNIQFDSVFTYGTHGDNRNDQKKYKSIFKYAGDDCGSKEDEMLAPRSMFNICASMFVTFLCYLLLILTLPLSAWFCFKTVKTYERLVIFRLGRLTSAKGPGVVLILKCIDRVVKIDLRMKAFSVPPQKILTNDNAAIEVGAEVYYRIADPIQSVNSVQDLVNSIRLLAQTTLMNHLIKQALNEIESNKPGIGLILQESINKNTQKWGVEVSRVEMSQIKVVQGPTTGTGVHQVQNLINMVAPALLPAGSHNIAQGGTTQPDHGPLGPIAQALGGMPQPQISPSQAAQLQAQFLAKDSMAENLHGRASSTGPAVLQVADECAALNSGGARSKKKLSTLDDLITTTERHLGPEIVSEFGLVFKFVATGLSGGSYFLDLKHGNGSVGLGEPNSVPDATLKLSSTDMQSILQGELSAFSAYMTGKLQIDGDVQGAMRLGQLFEKLN